MCMSCSYTSPQNGKAEALSAPLIMSLTPYCFKRVSPPPSGLPLLARLPTCSTSYPPKCLISLRRTSPFMGCTHRMSIYTFLAASAILTFPPAQPINSPPDPLCVSSLATPFTTRVISAMIATLIALSSLAMWSSRSLLFPSLKILHLPLERPLISQTNRLTRCRCPFHRHHHCCL